jgi:hypothetical protein
MADREEGKLHTSPSLRCVFERGTLVGRDMIGFVAFDFVLSIVFRSVMDMTFIIKVRGMDGDDGPCHTASFGIPAYMIAYLESPIHLSDSLLLPAAPHLGPLRPISTFPLGRVRRNPLVMLDPRVRRFVVVAQFALDLDQVLYVHPRSEFMPAMFIELV